MNKVLWFDCETTGLIPGTHALIQLAALVEIDNKVEEEIDLKIRPMLHNTIDPEALKISSLKEPEIKNWTPNETQFKKFLKTITKYVDRYDKNDKFILAGYNISAFDEPFLRQFFLDNAASKKDRQFGNYFGSYFAWPKRDIQTYVAEHYAELNLRLPNFKLETLCNHCNIEITAHDALSDILATRTLYTILRYTFPMLPTK